MINYCSGLLKEIMSEQKFVDTSKFEMNINIPTDAPTFPILSIRNYVGIISILAYPLVAYKITSNIHSDYYSIMIMMMGIVHFTPFFLKKAGKKTRIEWIVIALSINLGIIANISFFNFIIANIAFLVYVLKIRQNIKYFSALQYFLMTATINTILIFKEVGTPESIEIFCETHTLALVFYLALTLFLTLVLLNPPKIFIKNVELSKTM